eukprot:3650747-Rhodomonas_salina.1
MVAFTLEAWTKCVLNAWQDKTLSVAGVSKEVKNAVAQSVAGLLQNHTLLQQCAGKGSSPRSCQPKCIAAKTIGRSVWRCTEVRLRWGVADEGCTPGFKAKVVEDVKKLVFQVSGAATSNSSNRL